MNETCIDLRYYQEGLAGLRSCYYRHRIISADTYRACRLSFLNDCRKRRNG